MQDRIYLLSIEELLSGERWEEIARRADFWLDDTRRGKAARLKPGKSRAASVGAGLLLQLAAGWENPGSEAVWKEGQGADPDNRAPVLEYGVSQLLEDLAKRLPGPLPLSYTYGPGGKPYLEGFPIYFSLSHSGEYVLCAVSGQEIGADIQKMQPIDTGRLAGRFFAREECELLKGCCKEEERRNCFYRLWTRKEAFGKLTGTGVAGVLSENMWPDGDCVWRDAAGPPGYQMAVCTRKGIG